MIITCPNCHTRYEVAERAIGDRGRSVTCANCSRSWLADRRSAEPSVAPPFEPQLVVSAADENALDVSFKELDELKKPSSKGFIRARARVLARRQRDIARGLPTARIRRHVAMAAMGVAVVMAGALFTSRAAIVSALPDMASFYGVFGLQVNVVGLEFSEVRTVKTSRDGHEVLVVEGTINNVSGDTLPLPPVRVSLYRDDGTGIYEWRAAPGAPVLAGGAAVKFETQLMAPPSEVSKVRLRFDPSLPGPARGTLADQRG